VNIRWIALRIIQEIVRDKRTLALLFVVPIVVMTLIYYALATDEIAKVSVVSRGTARLFDSEIINVLENDDDVELVAIDIPDEETDPDILVELIKKELIAGHVDGVLYMDEQLLLDRFSDKRGTIHIFVEGSKPIITSSVFAAISSAMDDLAAGLPVVIDSSCSAFCADSVNNKTMDMEKHLIYGSDEYRLIDFFLPVFPTFFVFFFTFIISTISFQRERLRGTLERLQAAPIRFYEIVGGYVFGFFIFVTLQSIIIESYIMVLIEFEFSIQQFVSYSVVVILTMLVSLMLGLMASFLAANEFQAIQFIPLFILPQIFLSDMIWSIDSFPKVFKYISYAFPLTYSNKVARDVMIRNKPLIDSWFSLLVLVGFILLILTVMTIIANRKLRKSD